MSGRTVTLTTLTGGRTVSGEVILEHDLAWQLAVDGTVATYQKSEWTERSFFAPGRDSRFDDIFSMFSR